MEFSITLTMIARDTGLCNDSGCEYENGRLTVGQEETRDIKGKQMEAKQVYAPPSRLHSVPVLRITMSVASLYLTFLGL